MTNKLPEIGKKYKQIATNEIFTCVSFFGEGLASRRFAVLHSENSMHHAYLSAFWSRFEELPEDKPKDFHEKRIEELLRQLEFEILKGYESKEFDQELDYQKTLFIDRKEGKFSKLNIDIRTINWEVENDK